MNTLTPSLSATSRVGIFVILALTMLATRINHFGALPDASWAVLFIAGFYLRGSGRWAFPVLMGLAVLIDFMVITSQGINFWSHYCVSPAYWFLVPSYGAMWAGGSLRRRSYVGLDVRGLGLLIISVLVATSTCYLISNGSFYWISANVPVRSFAGWMENLGDWYLPYLRTTLMYVGAATALHIGALLAAKSQHGSAAGMARR